MFQNLTIKEVDDARKTASEGHFVINVSGSLSVCLSLSFSLSVWLYKKKKKHLCCFSLFLQISAHKTNQAFGAAQLALDQEEYGWLEEFLSLRSTLVGGKDAKYFFYTSKTSSCKNLNQYFQEAWASMGLAGTPTFTDVRTAIATHVSIPVHVPSL